jgi:putative methionine-R-sulfoxide reductase with GAF domain
MTAIIDMQPPQAGQARTSSSYTLRSDGPRRSADVHRFPGRIACDGASLSEIVVLMLRAGDVLVVLAAED